MYILDTNTISELRKGKMRRGNPGLAAWAATVDIHDQYLSVVTLQEIETGTLRAERKDPAKGFVLRSWMTKYILHNFHNRIIPVDTAIALRSGQLHADRTRPIIDTLIAATAYVHGMSVVTRNVSDFKDAGVNVINPWTP
jgi:predicted nucleic acid-binding protein